MDGSWGSAVHCEGLESLPRRPHGWERAGHRLPASPVRSRGAGRAGRSRGKRWQRILQPAAPRKAQGSSDGDGAEGSLSSPGSPGGGKAARPGAAGAAWPSPTAASARGCWWAEN